MSQHHTPTLLFDQDCALCRSLAGFAEKLSKGQVATVSWQEFSQTDEAKKWWDDPANTPADELRVVTEMACFEGEAAWEWLLANHPALKQVGWIADRLKLRSSTAKALKTSGHHLRRVCPWCPRW